MFCKNCGAEVKEKQAVCIKCGLVLNDKDVNKEKRTSPFGAVGLILIVVISFYGLYAMAGYLFSGDISKILTVVAIIIIPWLMGRGKKKSTQDEDEKKETSWADAIIEEPDRKAD